eukprot:757840-Hanusia_phi.AAC.1
MTYPIPPVEVRGPCGSYVTATLKWSTSCEPFLRTSRRLREDSCRHGMKVTRKNFGTQRFE